jgi:hypothetical protein
VHRLYRGKLDRPKSERSQRNVALSLSTGVDPTVASTAAGRSGRLGVPLRQAGSTLRPR